MCVCVCSLKMFILWVVQVCRGQRLTSDVFANCSPPCLRQGLSLTPDLLLAEADWPMSPRALPISTLGITSMLPSAGLLCGFCWSNSGPHVYVAITILTELAPVLALRIFVSGSASESPPPPQDRRKRKGMHYRRSCRN